jgi:prepilin-type processing-associated H-X9-DG protein
VNKSSATAQVVKTFKCPSDSMPDTINTVTYWAGLLAGTTNYFSVGGSNTCYGSFINQGNPASDGCEVWAHGDGIIYYMGWEHPNSIASVTDGTSNTLLVGERVYNPNMNCFQCWSGEWAWASSINLTCAIPLNYSQPIGQTAATSGTNGGWIDNYSFTSRHTGGANFARADGSVGFIGNDIALPIYRALGTQAGGEVASYP